MSPFAIVLLVLAACIGWLAGGVTGAVIGAIIILALVAVAHIFT